MDIADLQNRALEIREKYKTLEIKRYGKEWTDEKLVQGFLKDVTDLLDLIQNNGNKDTISHELSDCLWSILVLANKLNINLEESFIKNMNKLEKKLDNEY